MYFRMFITVAIGLYSSRIVLETLGITGYGVYNIVGGVVVIFSFISNALRNSTQRFLSFEIGKRDNQNIQKVFDASFQCHLYICIVLLIFAESVGLWFTNTQLNIPTGQEHVVTFVYQFSVITFLLQMLQVPYNSMIISHEKMGFYAHLSILEALLKLGILYFLVVSPVNKVILYSALIALVSFIILVIYIAYCHKKFGLKRFHRVHSKNYLKDIFDFSKWSMVNGCSNIVSQQGGNYLINIFSGVAANAAFGISNQATSVIYSFVSNFQTAFQPQIVKLYASDNQTQLNALLMRSSLLSYYLLLIIALPFCFEAQPVLHLWLGVVPEYSSIFCILILIYFLVDSIQAPLWMLIYSSGEIKQYTLVTGFLTILNLPMSFVLLLMGLPIYSIFIVRILLNMICSIYRLFYVKINEGFPLLSYISNVVGRATLVTLVSLLLVFSVKTFCNSPTAIIIFTILITITIIIILGFTPNDKRIIFNLMISKFTSK